ncbi:Protein of unknown function, partial [Gryllus bimaculatus]
APAVAPSPPSAGCALFFGAAALHGLRQLRKDAARSEEEEEEEEEE